MLTEFLVSCSSRQERYIKWRFGRLGFDPTLTLVILMCPWERHSTAISSAWRSYQAVLNFIHLSQN